MRRTGPKRFDSDDDFFINLGAGETFPLLTTGPALSHEHEVFGPNCARPAQTRCGLAKRRARALSKKASTATRPSTQTVRKTPTTLVTGIRVKPWGRVLGCSGAFAALQVGAGLILQDGVPGVCGDGL
jgi:hypothetical protein